MSWARGRGSKVEDFYAGLVGACRSLGDVKRVHARVVQSGHRHNEYLCNLLLQMYVKCGSVEDARSVFDGMDSRRPCPISWNMMVAAYAQSRQPDMAKSAFEDMERGRSVVSWTSLLQAYVLGSHLDRARWVFAKMPMVNVVTWTALIQGYVNAGRLEGARSTFDGMPERNVFSWNTLVAACAQEGRLGESRQMLERMPQWDIISWNIAVTAYAANGQAQDAVDIFNGMPQRNVVSWNAVMAAQGTAADDVAGAEVTFQSMPAWDSVSWNTVIAAYARAGQLGNAWTAFTRMPDRNRISWLAVIGMYTHHGHLDSAEAVFSIMPDNQSSSWNAMIAAYAKCGRGGDAVRLFHRMHCEGVPADEVSFITVLAAFTHEGLLDECRQAFLSMSVDHGLVPLKDHYCCMIDMLGRAGRVDLAEELVQSMPLVADAVTWGALLGACSNIHSDAGGARRAAEQLRRIDPGDVASYLLLTKVEAAAINGPCRSSHPAPTTSPGPACAT